MKDQQKRTFMGTGFSKKKKEAKLLQQQFAKMQDQLQKTEVTGVAGNGLVTLTLSGDGDLKHIKIKPECVDPEDIEGLETLIKAAHQDAQSKLQSQSIPGMPQLPGFPGLGE
jgi:nucleoid-associated protein EbfC